MSLQFLKIIKLVISHIENIVMGGLLVVLIWYTPRSGKTNKQKVLHRILYILKKHRKIEFKEKLVKKINNMNPS